MFPIGDISIQLDNSRTLWLMEISRQTFEEQGLFELEGDGGLFVILEDVVEDRFDVLAKAASFKAGLELLDLFTTIHGPGRDRRDGE